MILVLTDFTQMTPEKVKATIDLIDKVRQDDLVVYPTGLINGIAFQPLVQEIQNILFSSKNHWEANTSEQIKAKFKDFTEKFIISTSESVHKALVLEFNLEGREDFKSIRFKNEDNVELLRSAILDLRKSVNETLNLVSDLKLMVSSIFSSLPEDIQTTVNSKYTIAKSVLSNSMQLSADFVNFIDNMKPKLKPRKDIVSEYFSQSELVKGVSVDSFLQVWEKVSQKEDFLKFLNEKVIPVSMSNDTSLMTALASISNAVNKK